MTEYYHQSVVCHLIGYDIAVPLDVEWLRPGEGEETAAKRLLERVFGLYARFFDVVVGDALYLDAPFICYKHDPTAIVNFTLTLFIVFVLLQCFWLRNLKPQRRAHLTLIALAREIDLGLIGCRAPWHRQLTRGP